MAAANGRDEHGGGLEAIFAVRGRRALVTGAGSGLGAGMASALVSCGARVTLVDLDGQRLELVAKELEALPGEVRWAVADVRDATEVAAAVAGAAEAWGGLDAVFANAGISLAPGIDEDGGTLETTDLDRWHRVLAVNLDGVLHTLQAASPVLKAQRSGRIVVTASTAGLRGDPLVGYSYVAAKGAVVQLVRQAALELAPYGVHVNAIAPGPFRTNIGAVVAAEGSSLDDGVWERTVPLGRIGDPKELGGIAVLLASAGSSFMTGAVVPVDGGALVAYPIAPETP